MTSQKKKQKHKTTNNVVFLSFFFSCFVVARQWQIDMFPLKSVGAAEHHRAEAAAEDQN